MWIFNSLTEQKLKAIIWIKKNIKINELFTYFFKWTYMWIYN